MKKYIESHCNFYDEEANRIFTLTLTITFFIYLYFLVRNYRKYMSVPIYQKRCLFHSVVWKFFLCCFTFTF